MFTQKCPEIFPCILQKLRVPMLFLSLLTINARAVAQLGIPQVVVIHTEANEGYFQVCLNRNCVRNAGEMRKSKRMIRKRRAQMAKSKKRRCKKTKQRASSIARSKRRGNQNLVYLSSNNAPQQHPTAVIEAEQLLGRMNLEKVPLPEESAITGNNIPINEIRRFERVHFNTDECILSDSGKVELSEMVQYMNRHPNLKIEIGAHTDNRGTNIYNMALSEKRAKEVAEFLIDAGLAINRIKWQAYGASKPIVSNTSENNKALNRRVEYLLN